MQPITTTSRTLEFAPPCKQLALVLAAVSVLSFSLTWYRVWWDSIVGLLVAGFGYFTLRDANGQQLNLRHISWFYYGTITSMVSHVVAVAVVLYYMLQGHIFNNVLGIDSIHVELPGWVFFGFLLSLLGIEITLTAFTIWRCESLQAEIARNSVLADLTRGNAARDPTESAAEPLAPPPAVVDEAARAREEHLSGLRKRVAAYEQCVDAVGVLTSSLEELSAKIEAMKKSTQQLNAFTSGWLSVWTRVE